MPRVKVARKSTAIDMTAMCDVAFLLLTFFILTAKPKVDDPSKAEVPASTKKIPIPDDNVAMISIGKPDKVGGPDKIFFTVAGTDIRQESLKAMAEKYSMPAFTPAEINKFSNTEIFGVPMSQMKQFLNLSSAEEKKAFVQQGIPADTTGNNELSNWILTSRQADRALHGKDLIIAIKGDRQEQYPAINTVISVLEKQKVFKFNLITALRAEPKK